MFFFFVVVCCFFFYFSDIHCEGVLSKCFLCSYLRDVTKCWREVTVHLLQIQQQRWDEIIIQRKMECWAAHGTTRHQCCTVAHAVPYGSPSRTDLSERDRSGIPVGICVRCWCCFLSINCWQGCSECLWHDSCSSSCVRVCESFIPVFRDSL